MQMRAIATGVITVDLYREDCALLARICQVARESDVLANGTGDAAATLGALFALGAPGHQVHKRTSRGVGQCKN